MNSVKKITRKSVHNKKLIKRQSKTRQTDRISRYIQFRMTVGKREDKYEKEAEAVSKKVVETDKDENIYLSRKSADIQYYQGNGEEVSQDIENRIRVSLSYGQPLKKNLRSEFEHKFKADLKDVKIHTGNYASELNSKLGSEAFTYKNHIFFGEGKFNPETVSGKRLIAHELTHVLQQTGRKSKAVAVSRTEEKVQGFWGWIKKGWKKVKNLGKKVLELASDLKALILEKLSRYAYHIPGFYLLVYILGKNPITGKPVERNFSNLLTGIVSIIPGSSVVIKKIRDSGVAEKVGEWIDGKLKELNLSWDYVKSVFKNAVNSLTLKDLKDPMGAVNKVAQIISPLILKIKLFAGSIIQKIPEIIFVSILKVLKAPVNIIMSVINKGKNTLSLILNDPIGFLKNLVSAVKLGFTNFKTNIFKHLKKAFVDWLLGQLSSAGLKLPEKFDIKGIFSLIFQVLGLTYENIKNKLIKKLGREKVERIEKGLTFVKEFSTKGTKSISQFLSQKFSERLNKIKDDIFSQIKKWVVFRIIRSAVEKLILMWNPAGAIFEAVRTIYNIISFFYENIKRIKDVVINIFNSISQIALGQIKKAANYVENSLSKTLHLAINFLARFLKLGGLPKKIKNIIKKVRKPVDKLIDKLVDYIVEKGSKLLSSLVKKGKEKVSMLIQWWKRKISVKTGKKVYKIFFETRGSRAHLMISSSPKKSYREFINNLMEKYNLRNDQYPINEMIQIGSELDGLETQSNKNKNKIKPEEIIKKLNKFANLTKKLPIAEKCPPSVVKYEGVNKDGGAKGMRALILSKVNVEGSGPSDNPPIWKKLKPIRSFPPEYIRGHLLNENLGGPGKRWNLTPITKQANKNHYEKVEKFLTEKIKKGKNCPVFEYHVKVKYGERKKRKLQEELESANSKKFKAVKEALETERKLAKKLKIKLWEKNYEPAQKIWKRKSLIKNLEIENKTPVELGEERYNNILKRHLGLGKIIEINLINKFAMKKDIFKGDDFKQLREIITEERKRSKFKDLEDLKNRVVPKITDEKLKNKFLSFLKEEGSNISF
ncbi:eCIS core domain-containing protein [Persephonella sp.]